MHFEGIPHLSPIPVLTPAGARRVRVVARRQVDRCSRALDPVLNSLASGEVKGLLEQELNALDFDSNQTRLRAKAEIIARGMSMAELSVNALADACRGFGDLTDAGRTVVAVLPVARGGLEAAVGFKWLMDPTVNRHQRIVRMAAAAMYEHEMAQPMAESFTDQTLRVQQEEVGRGLQAALRDADIWEKDVRGARSFFSPQSRKPVSGRLHMTGLLSGDPELLGAWRLTSGAVHSRAWLIGSELATHPEAAHAPHMVAAKCLIRSCAMMCAVARETLDVSSQPASFFDNAAKAVHWSLSDSAVL